MRLIGEEPGDRVERSALPAEAAGADLRIDREQLDVVPHSPQIGRMFAERLPGVGVPSEVADQLGKEAGDRLVAVEDLADERPASRGWGGQRLVMGLRELGSACRNLAQHRHSHERVVVRKASPRQQLAQACT